MQWSGHSLFLSPSSSFSSNDSIGPKSELNQQLIHYFLSLWTSIALKHCVVFGDQMKAGQCEELMVQSQSVDERKGIARHRPSGSGSTAINFLPFHFSCSSLFPASLPLASLLSLCTGSNVCHLPAFEQTTRDRRVTGNLQEDERKGKKGRKTSR